MSINDEFTALHIAVYLDKLTIAELLLESGADVDCISLNGVTPIELSVSSEMTNLLDRFGASRMSLLMLSLPDYMFHWSQVTALKSKAFPATGMIDYDVRTAKEKDSWLGLEMFPELPLDTVPDWRQFLPLGHLRAPLLDRLRSDPMLGNYLLCWPLGHCFFLNSNFELSNLDLFPWHRISRASFRYMSFLRKTFRHFQRRFSQSTFRRWINLEPDRGYSPLCSAASLGLIDVIDNCLSIGADIDFAGCFLGSPLMVASASGRIDAVKLLVRKGAKIDYIGEKGHVSALSVTRSRHVKQWLLVGRFVEQGKIAAATSCESSQVETQFGRRSGIAHMKLSLKEIHYRWYEESTLLYAKRLGMLKRHLQGKVASYYDEVIY